VADLMSALSLPGAPRITQLDLAMNTGLTWRCTLALALALGAPPSADLESVQLQVMVSHDEGSRISAGDCCWRGSW
jgi:hypothetical protein